MENNQKKKYTKCFVIFGLIALTLCIICSGSAYYLFSPIKEDTSKNIIAKNCKDTLGGPRKRIEIRTNTDYRMPYADSPLEIPSEYKEKIDGKNSLHCSIDQDSILEKITLKTSNDLIPFNIRTGKSERQLNKIQKSDDKGNFYINIKHNDTVYISTSVYLSQHFQGETPVDDVNVITSLYAYKNFKTKDGKEIYAEIIHQLDTKTLNKQIEDLVKKKEGCPKECYPENSDNFHNEISKLDYNSIVNENKSLMTEMEEFVNSLKVK